MTKNSDGPRWYIAFVKSCQERRVADALGKLGVEHYLPLKREVHQWSDRKKIVETLVLPHMIFIRCKEHERVRIARDVWGITTYMATGHLGAFHPAVVRDEEMEIFRSMVDYGERKVTISLTPVAAGDYVRVTSGPFEGMKCTLVSVDGTKCLTADLGLLGSAKVELERDTVEKIEREN